MVQHARGCARQAKARPTLAVHGWRKAIRRARALLRLCADGLAAAEREAVSDALRAAQRAVSGRRDVDVLVPLIRTLGRQKSLDPGAKRALGRVRRGLRRSPREAGPAVFAEMATHFAPLGAASRRFEAGLPAGFAWDDIGRGFAEGYRQARRAFSWAKKRRSDARFHELRKRVKTMHYQTELLASTGSVRAERLRVKLADLARDQGDVTDLMLLASAARGVLPAEEPETLALQAALERWIKEKRAPVDRTAAKLFRRTPREAAARIVPRARACWLALG